MHAKCTVNKRMEIKERIPHLCGTIIQWLYNDNIIMMYKKNLIEIYNILYIYIWLKTFSRLH